MEAQWQKAKILCLKKKISKWQPSKAITLKQKPESQLPGEFANRDDMEKEQITTIYRYLLEPCQRIEHPTVASSALCDFVFNNQDIYVM